MTEENTDDTVMLEGMEPESGDMIMNSGIPVKEASDKNIDQREMERNVVTDENRNMLEENVTDTVDEPAEDVSPKSQIPDDMIGQTSTYTVIDLSGSLKRNSTDVIVGPDHKCIVRSRYRRVSIGSCHDLCKSGHKHEPGKVTKRPVLGTIRESQPLIRTISGGDNLAKYVPEKETKNKALHRRLSLPGPMADEDPKILTEATDSPKRTAPTQSKMKRVQSERKPFSVSTPRNSISRSKADVSAVKKTWQVKSSQKVDEMKVKEVCSSNASGMVKAKESMSVSSRTPLKISPSIKATLYKNLKSFSRSVYQSYSEDAKIKKSGYVPEKAVYVIKSNTNNSEKALKSSLFIDESPSIQRESSFGKTKKSNGNKKGTSFGVPSINTKEIGIVTKEGGSKTKIKRTGISTREEKNGSTWKVIFRRGTVVNPEAANNSSRKLRFKRGRILGEDQNAKVEAKKNLKSKDVMTNELPNTKPEAEKVRLRQQEASAKKDSMDLNNMIEETASKLAKTRKSKVKALVGAFETVMSFRECEPMAGTSTS